MNKNVPRLILLLFNSCILIPLLNAQPIIKIANEKEHINIGKSINILIDESAALNIYQILKPDNQKRFLLNSQEIPSIGVTNAALWCKLNIINTTNEDCFVEISNAALESIIIYEIISPDSIKIKKAGTYINYHDREILNNNYLFKLCRTTDTVKTYYIRVTHSRGTQFPIYIGTLKGFSEFNHKYDFLQGIYFGLMLLMIFYNLFVYFSVRDISYIYYVVYGAFMAVLNAYITGYGFEYLWPNHAILNNYEDVITAGTGISGTLFAMNFLQTKKSSPVMHKVFMVFVIAFCFGVIIVLLKYLMLGTIVIEILSLLLIVCFFITAFKLLSKGYKPAKFFLFAWSTLLLCVCLFILKDFDIVPYNMLTVYSLQIGSACEALLLSFALADKNNIYKKDKEEARFQILISLRENERLILSQNQMLETKVEERTAQLNQSLDYLKATQTQLIQSERLASQLETQEETFNKISRELHDNVGQLLSSTKLLLGMTERGMQNPPEALLTANETLGQAIKELRSLSKSLDKDWLEQFNFIENLITETNRINAADSIHVYLSHPASLPLKAELQIVLFRIVQEVLHNAIKHADAKNIHITITQTATKIDVSILDDGKGFNTEDKKINGSGINNIKHRTKLLGGTVMWQSKPGNGTGIIIALPVQNEIDEC